MTHDEKNVYGEYFLSFEELSKRVSEGSKDEDFAPSSPNENEFVSDSFQADEISQEDLKKEMQMLGVDDNKAETKTEKEEGMYIQGSPGLMSQYLSCLCLKTLHDVMCWMQPFVASLFGIDISFTCTIDI